MLDCCVIMGGQRHPQGLGEIDDRTPVSICNARVPAPVASAQDIRNFLGIPARLRQHALQPGQILNLSLPRGMVHDREKPESGMVAEGGDQIHQVRIGHLTPQVKQVF
jgi:hypothetical protein